MELPKADELIEQLVAQMRPSIAPDTALVGIHTGGVWLAERLHAELALAAPMGSIDVAFYRDDLDSRGLHAKARRSDIPFDVEGRPVVIVDDVLYTGRTTRAALNELFDYGRPARVDLAVLVDRGGRELPIEARYCAHRLAQPLSANRNLQLERDADGAFSLRLIEAK
ncbi:MAG: bifunctional pyr operon transcriptional regulator/uracil phosphoribosyltransferase PyrR [Candidatus Methylophosphatis roskildensis]|jgi:pyrimidine operon attenuation protein/uracil phosphoribosyltransferase|uniref:Bifunctional pyr operon transcriptional regulator/uracil phosphoribosyltransferase PyrR n=1 Tax=Candidatus Methylophosphatis roskildensis TaxID=2899263 RepID=A0A9D7DW64_9PROT|nr:bifunctional pyr operon transcriptional regulator/uracil phosphoribosyltransferase PyrR [Candidatus Methylophosphatis roskildensis]MBK7234905.1 bifunctional pyr operon transcriptional regulator/uracil phosphoribosyltransferase PyrR [Sterolibacteriaceae bacterium]MBK7662613.1 bifunctional pyr operon transcriptional regulator/uracil phosphoribosyltransferase PyrR [Sterolibacteriaceae bacterium]MBK9086725.1 bifunctional pyr operon transcriptional regulator/uracil phosphoribosyltransferase PyrR [